MQQLSSICRWHCQRACPHCAPGHWATTQGPTMSSCLALSATMVCCNTVPEEQPARSDHMLIVTILNAAPETQMEMPRANYRAADWEAIRAELAARLEELEVQED